MSGYSQKLNAGERLTVVTVRDGAKFRVVQPFPVVELNDPRELVRAPREYRTLTQHPEPIQVAA